MEKIENLWKTLYGDSKEKELDELKKIIDVEKEKYKNVVVENQFWYKESVVYSLYVDLYAGDFKGLIEKLPYLKKLGVNTLWLLPMLDSPMRDQGFDIRDYYNVRKELGGTEQFLNFVKIAHEYGIKILFDLAVNHTSDEHEWFKKAKVDKNSIYRDYYIWSDKPDKYLDARLLFKGMINSNWEYNPKTDDYYFHRFYGFQPDLNYKNPKVLIEMLKNLLFWKSKGIDGLRMDAIPFVWKKEGTNCEDLDEVHIILKIFRRVLDYVQEGTLLIAEANMKPKDVVKYFGDGDECQTAYHFPLMPKFYLSLAEKDSKYIVDALDSEYTPKIPKGCQWISFLRCHDELTLEFVTPEERKVMLENYLIDKKYSFREGEGIAGRIYNMLGKDIKKILLLNSMMFTTIGSPIIYYGDEIGQENDEEFYLESSKKTGYEDARFFNRGKMRWDKVEKIDKDKTNDESKLFYGIKNMIEVRKKYIDFFNSETIFEDNEDKELYIVKKIYENKQILFIHNLSENKKVINIEFAGVGLLTGNKLGKTIKLTPNECIWVMSE
ncbi:alpha-amylase family glycosyl hydrolase [Haliovirga abyssi]|uniref:Glycosyl hydrolase family 13 catalytic domain-containing protein n=1 Tax=Haliovirga abyssi TaxID=2996794 RepID=A0AAU9DQT5_9FUSO|nr:alpha-amylase family glycosyl hydrolase [Haliovirga abyssi]BDU50863.1 hypothetical protein HLVA_14320 [Haliovirga abyssi]